MTPVKSDVSVEPELPAFPDDVVECLLPLELLPKRRLSPQIEVRRAIYARRIPPHYRYNPLTCETIQVHVLSVQDGRLFVPATTENNFEGFYTEVAQGDPELYLRLISPLGTAKSEASAGETPIKRLVAYQSARFQLPGDRERYGWFRLAREAEADHCTLQLLFQGNGLYFNRGSAFYDGARLLVYPDSSLAALYDQHEGQEYRTQMGLQGGSLKRPLVFLASRPDGRSFALQHRFPEAESYQVGLRRLQQQLEALEVSAAISASPPLVLPDESGKPRYLTLDQALVGHHANDVRHYFYCPYAGAVLLYAELSRAQSLQPRELVHSLSGQPQDRLHLKLHETLELISLQELKAVLDAKGYRQRYRLWQAGGETHLEINLLEGVYSHLLPFVTRAGRFGLIQTSGTHRNITGNDGPTFRQLSAILRDLNRRPPFSEDPMVAAFSGSQGNDVPNVLCRDRHGEPGLLHELLPAATLAHQVSARGMVTTPRAGIVCCSS